MFESILNTKREKFRIDIRKQNLEKEFRSKRLLGIQNGSQSPTIMETCK